MKFFIGPQEKGKSFSENRLKYSRTCPLTSGLPQPLRTIAHQQTFSFHANAIRPFNVSFCLSPETRSCAANRFSYR